MNDHDLGGEWITDEDIRNLAQAMMGVCMPDMADAMTWFPSVSERQHEDRKIRSHP